jgi:hypothetical protein
MHEYPGGGPGGSVVSDGTAPPTEKKAFPLKDVAMSFRAKNGSIAFTPNAI